MEALAGQLAADGAAWALVNAGRAFVAAHENAEAARCFASARVALDGHPAWQAVAADQAGDALRAAGALAEADEAYQQALALRVAAAPRSSRSRSAITG